MPTLRHSAFSLGNYTFSVAYLKDTSFYSSFVSNCKYAFPVILMRH